MQYDLRKSLTLLICTLALGSAPLSARTFEIYPGQDRLHSLLPHLAAGDTILMAESGVYSEGTGVTLPAFRLTILASEGLDTRPVLRTRGGTFQLLIRSDILLRSITFNGAGTVQSALRLASPDPNSVIVQGCEFIAFTGDAISTDDLPVKVCDVSNSVFSDIGRMAIGFEGEDMVGSLTVSNSTFHHLGQGAVEVTEAHSPLSVRVSDVTIHDSHDGIVLKGISEASVSGVIFSTLRGSVIGGTGDFEISNSCIFDSERHEHVKGAKCLNCLKANPEFYDPANADFSLLPESPCLWLGESHTPIGDPRWSGEATRLARSRRDTAVAVRWAGGIGSGAIALVLIASLVRRRFHRATIAALVEAEDRHQYLLRSSPAVLYSRPLDQPFGFSFVSASVVNLLGLREDDILSDPDFFKWRIHMEDLPGVMGERQRVSLSGQHTQEYRIQGGDGKYRWIRDETFLVRDDSGGPSEIVGTIVDVTSRVEAEQDRMAAEAELEEQRALSMRADRLRSLGEMAAGIAHELNQPLTGVRGYAELTLMDLTDGQEHKIDELMDREQAIIDQVDRMSHIINHVRLFAREAGNSDREVTRVEDIVQSSLGLLGTQLGAYGIDLRTSFGDGLPSVSVNPYSLEEVLLNMLTNARDAMENRQASEPSLIEVATDLDEEHGLVRIRVTDNGVGIPLELQERVWEPFFTTKDPDRGTGLGLSICRSIVESCSGRLELDSEPGRGTVLTILLPPYDEAVDGNEPAP